MLVESIVIKIRNNLEKIAKGQRVEFLTIGYFTQKQFDEINDYRNANGLPALLSKEIIYLGKHHFESRVVKDKYSIDDLIKQIESALKNDSEIEINSGRTGLRSTILRDDGYGNQVTDIAAFELTAKKPKAELYSVIPKGDVNKPSLW
ncbi:MULTISPECIES: hypothetical protein [Pasteurellaceae]|uniref:Uncharacterized protein n=1 Tax=Avibacterium paragallinarum TaxID=728 RepID=A0ABU7QSR1_AVIPA|nr:MULTISPECIES: hypothetical protein [Pasteurellaceae]KGQ43085.1 hypothetical protein JP28_10035 [Gallibacterium anatis]KGQ53010.1 hypothetical protein IO46_04730 [Gallibacterium anatis]KGQ59133.1 hypothetical protein IO45_07145 [Gallibacterium anatis]